jgi:hypothetical protein
MRLCHRVALYAGLNAFQIVGDPVADDAGYGTVGASAILVG